MELIAVILLVLLVLFGEVGLYRRRGLEGLSYYCHFSETERTEGESLQFVETVTNDKTLPVPWLKAELTTSRWLDFPEANSAVTGENRFVSSFFSVRSRSRVSRVWEITCEKRGVYEMEHIVLVTSDLLGIVRLSLHAADHGEKLTVLPKRLTEAGLLLPKLLRQQYGEQAVRYLGGEAWRLPYRVLFCLAAGVGAVVSLRSVWALSDIANGLMAVPNLLGLLLLGKQIGTQREK